MEISEQTHERKDVIVVGTAFSKGEDIAARGNIYVFDVIDVVPDPEQPETNLQLKLIGKESIKGSITALSGIGGQGFLIASQGQKCMVRGLKDDGSILPVAFIDVQCYVSVIKELKGTGMCLIGDALKGLWFAGYSVRHFSSCWFLLRQANRYSWNYRKSPIKWPYLARTWTSWKLLRPTFCLMARSSTFLLQTATAISTSSSMTRKVRDIHLGPMVYYNTC